MIAFTCRPLASATALALGLGLGLAAAPATAQRITKEPAPVGDTAHFAVLLNADTLALESYVRSGRTLAGELQLLRPRPMTLRYTAFLRADGTVDSLHTTTVDAAPARTTFVFARDSAMLTMVAGSAEPRVHRMPVPAGTLPFINLSSGVTELVARRARIVGGPGPMPLLAGTQVLPGRITALTADTMVLDLGVELRAAVGPEGRLRGAVVPSQGVRFVRLAARPARVDGRPSAADYAAPPGAPYTAEPVTIRTADGAVLAGTLTLPRRAGAEHRVPVVVTISGSGAQNRDSELTGIPGYRVFRQLADTLGRRGIGVLRLDDRGAGASSAAGPEVTTETFAGDVRAALAWLRTRPDVDHARLALLGHSEGGIIAPLVAAEDSLVVALVLLAAQSRPGVELSAHQRRAAIANDPRVAPAARDSVFGRAQAEADSLVRAGGANAWTRFWWTHDPLPVLRRVRVPVLVLHGETDAQVPVAQAEETAAALRAAGNRDVTVRRFPDVNHLFLADPSGHWEGYATLPSKAVPAPILGTIVEWLAVRLGRGT